jgi:hypothetical protein
MRAVMAALPQTATPRLHQAIDWWERLRGARAMPRPDEICLSDIPLVIANMLLVEMEGLRIRRAGPALRVRFETDLTGRPLTELPGLVRGTRAWSLWESASGDGRPHYLEVPYLAPDRSVRCAQDLLLPFSADGQRIHTILAVLEFAVPMPGARAA